MLKPVLKINCVFAVIILLFVSANISAQDKPVWKNLSGPGNVVRAIAVEDSFIWTAASQVSRINIHTGKTETFNSANSALTSNLIDAILVDSKKNKWFASPEGGLIKYDGRNWTAFNTQNSLIPYDEAYSLAEDNKGSIWIGTHIGITKFDGSQFTSFTGKNIPALSYTSCYSIAFDKNNVLWAAGDGLIRYDGKVWEKIDLESITGYDLYIRSISIAPDNTLWLAAAGKLISFDGTNWKIHDSSNNPVIENQNMLSVYADKTGKVWASSIMGGLYCFENKEWKKVSRNSSEDWRLRVNDMAFDGNNYWLATYDSGLIKYDGSVFTNIRPDSIELPSNQIRALGIDQNDTLWLQYENKIVCGRPYSWRTVKDSLDIYGYISPRIKCDRKNNLWLLVCNFSNTPVLNKYDGKNFTRFPLDGLYIHMYDLYPYGKFLGGLETGRDGDIWFALGYRLFHFNEQKGYEYFTGFNSIIEQKVTSVVIDRDDNKWIGTLGGGLVKFDGTNWTRYDIYNSGLASNDIYNIVLDNNNGLWIGTGSGLVHYSNGGWIPCPEYYIHSAGDYRTMAVDKNNTLWIGDNSVKRFKDFSYSDYNIFNSGIPDNSITGIAIDRNNSKWILTEYNGIAIYNENGITAGVNLNSAEDKKDKSFNLAQNYPNPFNPVTSIAYSIPKLSYVELKVYDLLGREISVLVSKEQSAGEYKVQFNASSLPSGIYIYTIQAGQYRDSKKLMLLK